MRPGVPRSHPTVVTNPVHASLRDHRVGFVVLSLAGLGILGVMILITLQRVTAAWRAGSRPLVRVRTPRAPPT
jgi:hypothetical protein